MLRFQIKATKAKECIKQPRQSSMPPPPALSSISDLCINHTNQSDFPKTNYLCQDPDG